MMTTDSASDDFLDIGNNLEGVVQEFDISGLSSEEGSDISISEKIVMESNEKRLRQRMNSLQTSIMNLKEQLKQEKELWKEDMEKIRTLQQQQQEMKCTCMHQTKSKEAVKGEMVKSETIKCEILSRTSSNYTLGSGEATHLKKFDDIIKTHSIKQLLELQNYRRKLAETENMCNLELTRVKQSLQDLKTLQSIASEWGKGDGKKAIEEKETTSSDPSIQEIFVKTIRKTE